MVMDVYIHTERTIYSFNFQISPVHVVVIQIEQIGFEEC